MLLTRGFVSHEKQKKKIFNLDNVVLELVILNRVEASRFIKSIQWTSSKGRICLIWKEVLVEIEIGILENYKNLKEISRLNGKFFVFGGNIREIMIEKCFIQVGVFKKLMSFLKRK
jgi:hypothetical protein